MNFYTPAFRRYLSEFIGTFALVFCGTGAIIINDVSGGTIGHGGIAITFGLVVSSMIYALGDVSGAHLNPAVTFAFWIGGRFNRIDIIPYVFSQIAGAMVASAILKWLFPSHPHLGASVSVMEPEKTMVMEFVVSFLLMFVIASVSTGPKEKGIVAGLAIGSVVLLAALFAGPATGASMNPARSLAPAVVSGHFENLWIYITTPVLGAISGIAVHLYIFSKDPQPIT